MSSGLLTKVILCFQVEKKEDGIAGEREENPVMEAVSERERESEEKEAR